MMINGQFSPRETTLAAYHGDNILVKSVVTNMYDVDL